MRISFSTPLLFPVFALCVIGLTACVAPTPALNEAERAATVEAIQTRVMEIRATQSAAQAVVPPAAPALPAATADTANGPTAEQSALLATLRPQGDAPELFNEVWLNSDPLKLADLRGNVVIVEFWTYG